MLQNGYEHKKSRQFPGRNREMTTHSHTARSECVKGFDGTTEVIIWLRCPIPCFQTGHDENVYELQGYYLRSKNCCVIVSLIRGKWGLIYLACSNMCRVVARSYGSLEYLISGWLWLMARNMSWSFLLLGGCNSSERKRYAADPTC
jgi:hypothetical protein